MKNKVDNSSNTAVILVGFLIAMSLIVALCYFVPKDPTMDVVRLIKPAK